MSIGCRPDDVDHATFPRVTLEGVSGVHVDEGDDGSSMAPTPVIGVAADAADIDTDRRRALREALVDGENSGKSTDFSLGVFLGRMRSRESPTHGD
jgi:Bacterial antitoxin of ParD toxin-antitoxin type II system and RHH